MKLFNSLHELWQYCLFCPICRDFVRDPLIQVGFDDDFKLLSFNKSKNDLVLNTTYSHKKNIAKITFIINCKNNSFIIDIKQLDKLNYPIIASPYFFFYIQASCGKCNASNAYGSDIEFNYTSNEIYNTNLDGEVVVYDKYHIQYEYQDNLMYISPIIDELHNGVDLGKPISLPIINFDFSDLDKLLLKIKTILIFS